jgi:tRNA(Ile)-lysidine synthase
MNPPAETDWSAAADALHAAFPVARWPERVLAWAETEARADQPWCVALSGGADSVAVLLTLCGLRNADRGMRIAQTGNRRPDTEPANRESDLLKSERGTQCALSSPAPEFRNPQSAIRNDAARANASHLLALHFNHRLRGAAADGDEAFCRALCAALGVELIVGAADWPEGSDVSEAQAREARFAFFGRAMRERGTRALWLGHHRDDVVETMLLRLSRGSGARGLAAPRPVQRLADGTVRLRPLLEVPKTEIVAALCAAGVPWCEDATNHGEAYFRNRLRNRVLPAWREAAPADLAAAVARSRSLLEEEDEALELWTDRVLPAELGETLPLAELRAAPVAVVRRALHRWLGAMGQGGVLSSTAFDELLSAVRAGRATRLSAGDAGFLETTAKSLRIAEGAAAAPEWASAVLAVPGEVALPDGAVLRAAVVELDAELHGRICAGELDDGRTAFLALEGKPAALDVRPWRAGDRYRPLGAGGASKLQDQFVNRHIPRELRGQLPVVCASDGAILWVPGMLPAHEVRIGEGTAQAVQLTYSPGNSLSGSTAHV